MIGNDIIDLELAATQSNWQRRGYLSKLYSFEEQSDILNSITPEKTLWRYWSMKEAAYKAHQRRFNLPRRFNPINYKCNPTSEKTGFVVYKGYRYNTTTNSAENYIYTLASASLENKVITKVLFDSEEITESLKSQITIFYQLGKNQISLEKNSNSIPHLIAKGERIPVDFSLTHHGRYSAFAIALMNY